MTIKSALKLHSIIYWFVITISALLFFMAHNRVYTFYILTPVLFYILSATKLKTKPLPSIAIFIGLGVLLTLFKLFGLDNMFASDNIAVWEMSNYDRFASFSPFTSELAASIFADSGLFYEWHKSGIYTFGSTFVVGALRSFSGLVPLFFLITGLSLETYDPASYVSKHVSLDYGIGSSISGDLIASFGFCMSLIIMFVFGRACCFGDRSLSENVGHYKGVLIGMCISSQIIFVARSSLCDVISSIVFCLIFSYFYFKHYHVRFA